MRALLHTIRRIPIWQLIAGFALLRGVEKTVEALVIQQDRWLLMDVWCPAIITCSVAVALFRYRSYPFWIRAITGLGTILYTAKSIFVWKTRIPLLQSTALELLVLVVLAGFCGITLVYLTQAFLRLAHRRQWFRTSPSAPAS